MRKFTIKDNLVIDSLNAIDAYRSESEEYKPVIHGGIANQLYTNRYFPNLLRPTNDLDILVAQKMDPERFRKHTGPGITSHLEKHNPAVNIRKHVYEVMIKDDEMPPFLIHFYRYTKEGWRREENDTRRQIANANVVGIPNSKGMTYVVRPEDLMIGKVRRLRTLGRKKKLLGYKQGLYQKVENRDWDILANQNLEEWVNRLTQEKNILPAMYESGEKEFIRVLDDYTSSKDLYDISLIARLFTNKLIGFDEKYYDRITDGTE